MIIRLLAVAALLVSAGTSVAVAVEGQTECNCPKCQAARQEAAKAQETYNAMPAGLFAAPPSAEEIRQAGHHNNPGPMPPTNQHPSGGPYPGYGLGPTSFNNGQLPYGWNYNYDHPGRMYTGGRYGPAGGAHGTPGYPRHMHMHREYTGPQGPPTAAVAYPYYTTRGPRDFLLDNPPSIGR